MNDPEPLTELDASLTSDERRTCSVEKVIAFRESIAGSARTYDEIDLDTEIEDINVVDPDERHAATRKSGKEVNRLLDLLDSLDNSNGQGGKA